MVLRRLRQTPKVIVRDTVAVRDRDFP